MNPILIKPMGESISQIVVKGKPFKDMDAQKYYEEFASKGIKIALKAFGKLRKKYDLIIVEGAGNPAEINLYHADIANMKIAEMTGSPVMLVADIERGGVFASIYGTVKLLEEKHRKMMKGVVINKFRGNEKILEPGISKIEKIINKPVLGVIPFIENLRLPEEDSVALETKKEKGSIFVIKLPRISNFSDFDPLIFGGAKVEFVENAEHIVSPKAIIIPGTKNTVKDLEWLKMKGFAEKIKYFHGRIPIIGICGGYQILGKKIIERKTYQGLGLLDVTTEFKAYKKITRRIKGKIIVNKGIFKEVEGEEVKGYEIHMGNTYFGKCAKPAFDLGSKLEGCVDETFTVLGTYIHGLFDLPPLRKILGVSSSFEAEKIWKKEIERASAIVSEHLDIRAIERWING
jgi:adenosylcobyric acid synthase